jgi:hypothetical protein
MLHQVCVINRERARQENVYVNVTSSLCDKPKKSSSDENVYVNVTSSLSD